MFQISKISCTSSTSYFIADLTVSTSELFTFSGVVVAVGGAVGELEEVAEPEADLGGDPGREPLEGRRLQRRDVRRERVADHAEQRSPVRQLHQRVALAGAKNTL